MVDRTSRRSGRDRLLASADALFYEEGVGSVGINRVIEHAGVAKATLYRTYGSKDALIRAYLTRRHRARQDRIARKLADIEEPRERILGVFDALDDLVMEPSYRGCPFLNASGEARPGGAVQDVTDETRAWVRDTFRHLCVEARAADPDELSHQLVLLYDGASVAARLDRNPAAVRRARGVAAFLVDAATVTIAVSSPAHARTAP